MQHTIQAQWMGKMQFNALVNGHTLVMDAPQRSGGEDNGPTPKPFILTAIAGCTGMDVVALLKKENVEMSDFNLEVSGELSKHAPVEYVAAHIKYVIKGPSENAALVLAAVNDSQEKYCGVSHMIKKAMPITWEVEYNGDLIFNNRKMQPIAL